MSTVHFTAAPNVINRPQQPNMIFPKYMIQSLYWDQGCKAILKTDNPSYFDNRAKEPYPEISKKMNEDIEVMKANEDKIFTELAQTMESHARKLEAAYRDNLSRAEELACATARLKRLEIKVHQLKQDELWRNVCTSLPGPPHGQSPTEAPTESRKASTLASSTLGRMSYQSHDMSDIATTLAAMPKGPLSVSSSSSFRGVKKRRPMKPHREEHVKRTRVTYDRNGGQKPNIPPNDLSNTTGTSRDTQHQTTSQADATLSPESAHIDALIGRSTENTVTDDTSELSFTNWMIAEIDWLSIIEPGRSRTTGFKVHQPKESKP